MYSSEGQNKDKKKSKTLLNFDFLRKVQFYIKKMLKKQKSIDYKYTESEYLRISIDLQLKKLEQRKIGE